MSDGSVPPWETRSFSMDGDGKLLGPAMPAQGPRIAVSAILGSSTHQPIQVLLSTENWKCGLSLVGSLQIPAFDRRDEQAVD
jgi:hypothetical protein